MRESRCCGLGLRGRPTIVSPPPPHRQQKKGGGGGDHCYRNPILSTKGGAQTPPPKERRERRKGTQHTKERRENVGKDRLGIFLLPLPFPSRGGSINIGGGERVQGRRKLLSHTHARRARRAGGLIEIYYPHLRFPLSPPPLFRILCKFAIRRMN